MTRPTLTMFFAALFLLGSAAPAYLTELEIITHKTEEEGLPANAVSALTTDGGSGVFVASDAGLHIFLDYFFLPVFQRLKATRLCRDPKGDVWAATDSALIYRVSPSADIWSAVRYTLPYKKTVTAIAARHDALFVGTDSGLYYISGGDQTFRPVMGKRAVSALCVLPDGTLIAAVRDKSPARTGLTIIGGEFASRTGWVDELSGFEIRAFFYSADRLFIGTRDGAVLILDEAGIWHVVSFEKVGRIDALLVSEGMLVIGSERGLFGGGIDGPITGLPTADGGTIGPVTSLAPGPDLTIWVGTDGDGLYLVRIHP